LNEATLEVLARPKRSYPPILLGIANLPTVSREQAAVALLSYREGLVERLEHVTARAESQRPVPNHVEMLFTYSLTMIEAEKNWVEGVIQKLKEA
jgi:hypothetical protein